MSFGMKNATATFQQMLNKIIDGLEGYQEYIDDVIEYGESWEKHLSRVRSWLDKLKTAKLTVNLLKNEFDYVHVTYLGHVVGQDQVSPVSAKIEAIVKFPAPMNWKSLMHFLEMAGYYRKLCKNFSTIVNSMTQLLKEDQHFVWTK